MNSEIKFSVLMSVYKKEKAEYFDEALKSVLNQTRMPNQIVIVCDGTLTTELYSVINTYINNYSDLFTIIKYPDNKGLGKALNIGLAKCKFDYVARMDTDDICKKDRFEKQIDFLSKNAEIAILGTYIAEFETNINNIYSYREVPTESNDIIKYAHKRNPFNHMTVIFKKKVIIEAGGYQDMPLAEDYYLWARVLEMGYKCANLKEPLLYARAGDDMIERRSGLGYAKKINHLRYTLYKMEFITFKEYIFYSTIHALIAICPICLKRGLYNKFLHKASTKKAQ